MFSSYPGYKYRTYNAKSHFNHLQPKMPMPHPQMLSSWHMCHGFLTTHTQNRRKEQGEGIGKMWLYFWWTFLFCIRKRCLTFNFWSVGKHLQGDKPRFSFFRLPWSPRKHLQSHTPKKHLPKHTSGSKTSTSNLHLPDLQMWRIFHMICLIRHFQSFTHGSRIDLHRFRAELLGPSGWWLSLATNTAQQNPRKTKMTIEQKNNWRWISYSKMVNFQLVMFWFALEGMFVKLGIIFVKGAI